MASCTHMPKSGYLKIPLSPYMIDWALENHMLS